MYNNLSNIMFNHEQDDSFRIVSMHPQMERLYEVAQQKGGIRGQTQLAKALNSSPQTLNNWEERGISKRGLIAAEERFGCSAVWLESGKEENNVDMLKPPIIDASDWQSFTPQTRALVESILKSNLIDSDIAIIQSYVNRLSSEQPAPKRSHNDSEPSYKVQNSKRLPAFRFMRPTVEKLKKGNE